MMCNSDEGGLVALVKCDIRSLSSSIFPLNKISEALADNAISSLCSVLSRLTR